MSRDRTFRILQAVACLLCAILIWRYDAPLEGTEFSAGRITGPLLEMANVSILLFAIGLILSFFRSRLSAAVTLGAALLALPLFLYFTCPGPFRYIFKGNYSVPAPQSLVLDIPSLAGVSAIILAMVFSCRNLSAVQSRVKS